MYIHFHFYTVKHLFISACDVRLFKMYKGIYIKNCCTLSNQNVDIYIQQNVKQSKPKTL